jgi:hypothetical protein
MSSPFEWMPKPGQSVRIPGGVLWCEEWSVNWPQPGIVKGEIRFRFQCNAAAYDAATKQKDVTEIEGQSPALPTGAKGALPCQSS